MYDTGVGCQSPQHNLTAPHVPFCLAAVWRRGVVFLTVATMKAYGFCLKCKLSSRSYPLRCPECKQDLRTLKKRERRRVFLLALGFSSYARYLASDLWLTIRAKAMESAGGKCARCGGDATQVHHTEYSYEALRGDRPKTLVALCRVCHKFIEFHPDGRKTRQGTANKKLRGEYDPSRKYRSRPEIGQWHAGRQSRK